jgi:hypothetical protein
LLISLLVLRTTSHGRITTVESIVVEAGMPVVASVVRQLLVQHVTNAVSYRCSIRVMYRWRDQGVC